jgi:hypothetical protein
VKPRTLLILALVVILGAAFVWFVERDLPGSAERAELERKVLGDLDPADVTAVSITTPEGRVRLERQEVPEITAAEEDGKAPPPEPRWHLVGPVDAAADAQAVERLLNTLARLQKRQTIKEPDPAELGLEPPAATVTLETADGSRTLLFGAEVAVTGDRIVTLEGAERAWTTEGEIHTEIARPPGDWRSRDVLHLAAADVSRLAVSGSGREAPLAVERLAEESFRLSAPVEDAADRDRVRRVLSELAALQVARFVDDLSALEDDPGLDPPRFVVEVEPVAGRGAPETLEIGTAAGLDRVYARVREQAFEAEAADLAGMLGRPLSWWRSHLATDRQIFELAQVRVLSPDDDEMTLARADPEWTRDGEPIPYASVRELLLTLTGLAADEIVTATEARAFGLPRGEPTVTFVLVPEASEADEEEETIVVYDDPGQGVILAPDRRDVLLRATEEAWLPVEEALAGVREARPVGEGG